jgi:acyl-CoA synthetase (NDP forming)
MFCFLTKKWISLTDIYYAVDTNSFIDICDDKNFEIRSRGINAKEGVITVSTNHKEATHIILKDAELIASFCKAIRLFEANKVPVIMIYSNVITVSKSDVSWAEYRIHIAYENE